MADASRKLRILRLLDLLRSETDDEHCQSHQREEENLVLRL